VFDQSDVTRSMNSAGSTVSSARESLYALPGRWAKAIA
jgi:hypothetical protein